MYQATVLSSSYSQTNLRSRSNHPFTKEENRDHGNWITCQGSYSRADNSNLGHQTLWMWSYLPIAHFQMWKKTIINKIRFTYFNKSCRDFIRRLYLTILKQKSCIKYITLSKFPLISKWTATWWKEISITFLKFHTLFLKKSGHMKK